MAPRFRLATDPAVRRFAELAAVPEERHSLVYRAELLSWIVSIFASELDRQRPAPPRIISAEHRFREVICEMPDAEFLQHTPDDLAKLCDCSPRQFSRLFKNYFHTSARERRRELRLLKAQQILGTTREKIVKVALECGYRNVRLFNCAFKERFGVTPSEFRRDSIRRNKNAATTHASGDSDDLCRPSSSSSSSSKT